MKLAGATYMDVHKMGGGINFTVNYKSPLADLKPARDVRTFATVQVRHTRNSSEDELRALLLQRLDRMLAQGTVLVRPPSRKNLEFYSRGYSWIALIDLRPRLSLDTV